MPRITFPSDHERASKHTTRSYCSKLGSRLGRIKVWGMIRDAQKDEIGLALSYHTLHMARGASILAEELGLTPGIIESLQALEAEIANFFEQYDPHKAGWDKDAVPTFVDTISGLVFRIGAEIEVFYEYDHVDAFFISYDVYHLHPAFILRDEEGQRVSRAELKAFILRPEARDYIKGRLSNLFHVCQKLHPPPLPPAEIHRYLQGFKTGLLSDEEAEALRDLVILHWPATLESYFSPIGQYDLKAVEAHSGLTVERLVSQSLRLGSFAGRLSLLPLESMFTLSDTLSDDAYKLSVLLRHLQLPVEIEKYLDAVNADDQLADLPDKEFNQRVATRFFYEIVMKSNELINCFYGDLAANVFMVGYQIGRAEAAGSLIGEVATERGVALEEFIASSAEFRERYVEKLTEIQKSLKSLPVADELLQSVAAHVELIAGPQPSAEQLREARAFFDRALYDAVLAGVRKALGEELTVPDEFAPLAPYLTEFLKSHPRHEKNVFVMMRFMESAQHTEIMSALEETLHPHGLNVLRADRKDFTGELWSNVCVYMLGCKYGIAVFEEIHHREFNPNIALELGFMMAHGKRVLLLKDKDMPHMPKDVMGKLYKEFNTYDIAGTVPPQLRRWLIDIGLGAEAAPAGNHSTIAPDVR